MLIEEMGAKPGFNLNSADISDKMLKYAVKTWWERRKEQAFFNWTIEESNWMTLSKDVKTPWADYDAILCIGNSFPNLMNLHGDFGNQKTAFRQFFDIIRPRGILIIDHRNYDYILNTDSELSYLLTGHSYRITTARTTTTARMRTRTQWMTPGTTLLTTVTTARCPPQV